MVDEAESNACTPVPVTKGYFNSQAFIPYGCHIDHIYTAMNEFCDFLGFINRELYTKQIPRLETMLMPANFSSIVGEFMTTTIPKYCLNIVKNRHHNGHPDLIPIETFPGNSVRHVSLGIEVKASRYVSGWQGHNRENIWLLVFVFASDKPELITPQPFRFLQVLGAQLEETDWTFAGRSETSRRTITASINRSSFQKMQQNWIYRTT